MGRFSNWKHNIHWLWITAGVVIVDQLTKWWAMNGLTLGRPVRLVPFLNLTLVHNRGMAFSFLSQAGVWQEIFLAGAALTACVVISMIILWSASQSRLTLASLALILGGALGNLIDRMLYGYVIDFIDFHVAAWHWPAFNAADSAITIGALCIIFEIIWFGDRGKTRNQ